MYNINAKLFRVPEPKFGFGYPRQLSGTRLPEVPDTALLFNIGIQVHLHLLINQRKGSFPVSTHSSSTMIPGVNASRFVYFIFAMAVDTLKRNKLAFFHNPDLD